MSGAAAVAQRTKAAHSCAAKTDATPGRRSEDASASRLLRVGSLARRRSPGEADAVLPAFLTALPSLPAARRTLSAASAMADEGHDLAPQQRAGSSDERTHTHTHPVGASSAAASLATPILAGGEAPSLAKPTLAGGEALAKNASNSSSTSADSSMQSTATQSTAPTSPGLSRASISLDERLPGAMPAGPVAVPVVPLSPFLLSNPNTHHHTAFDNVIPPAETRLRAQVQLAQDLDARRSSRPGDPSSSSQSWFAIRSGRPYAPLPKSAGGKRASAALRKGKRRVQPWSYSREFQDLFAIKASIAEDHIGGLGLAGSRLARDGEAGGGADRARAGHAAPLQPERVLDLACGVAAPWCIAALQAWPAAEVVALDAAPVQLDPAHLPEPMAARLRLVQHDITSTPWPFPDGHFDLVRCAHVGWALEEEEWQGICEEAARVLRPGGAMELVELSRRGKAATGAGAPAIDAAAARARYGDGFGAREATFLRAAAVATHAKWRRAASPLSVLPAVMSPDLQSVWVAQRLALDEPDLEPAARGPDAVVDRRRDEAERVLAAATAHVAPQHFATSAEDYLEAQPSNDRVISWPDCKDACAAYRDNILQRANIAELLASRCGWRCDMDLRAKDQLEQVVDVLQRERDRPSTHGEADGAELPAASRLARVNELEHALQDATNELTACKRRLGLDEARRLPPLPDCVRTQVELGHFAGRKRL